MLLGDVIRKYRNDNGVSMQRFADKAGVSKGYISMLENNKNPSSNKPIIPSIDTIKKIAVAMELSIDELIQMIDGEQEVSLVLKCDQQPNPSKPAKHTDTIQEIIEITKKLSDKHQLVVLDAAQKELKRQRLDEVETAPLKVYENFYHVAGVANWNDDIDPPQEWDIPVSLLSQSPEFGVPISGNSMMPEYPNGSIALIKTLHSWHEGIGKVCAVVIDGEYFIKQIGEGKLISFNRAINKKTGERMYPDIHIGEFSEAKITGEVVAVYRPSMHNEY